MMTAPTANTLATLLLTAPLGGGRGGASAKLFSVSEYRRLVKLLQAENRQPGDLLGSEAHEVLALVSPEFPPSRFDHLLGRGFLLSQALYRWNARGIWAIGPGDEAWPRRIEARLKEEAPAILYGCGEAALLETGGFGVVGSRQPDEETVGYAAGIGRFVAEAGCTLLAGTARGIDLAAAEGALSAGGKVVALTNDALERLAVAREWREALMEKRLALLSPWEPGAVPAQSQMAERSRLMYGLAEAALVVTCDLEKGNTWAGAVRQLELEERGLLFVRADGKGGSGNEALRLLGALPWPEPRSAQEFRAAINVRSAGPPSAATVQETFSFDG